MSDSATSSRAAGMSRPTGLRAKFAAVFELPQPGSSAEDRLSTPELEACYRGAYAEHTVAAQVSVALACSLVALLVRFSLNPVLGLHQPFTTAFAAVAFAAWYGTWRAGLLCAIVSHLWAHYFFIEPIYSIELTSHRGLSALLYYFLVAVLLYTSHRARRARWIAKILLARLRASDRQKSDLLAILSHELRTPLSAATASVGMIELRGESHEVRARATAMLRRQLEHMSRLTSDLTDAARINEGKVELLLRRMTVPEVMHAALESLEPVLVSRRQRSELVMDENLPELEVDPLRINQVLTNLLYNASKFSPETGTIKVEVSRQVGGVCIRVVDWGAGIPREELAGVFDSYIQLRGGSEGLGLGLALVRRLVEMHGGTVRALSSGLGQGSTFEVCLPSPDTV